MRTIGEMCDENAETAAQWIIKIIMNTITSAYYGYNESDDRVLSL